jgi:hypothetical protein
MWDEELDRLQDYGLWLAMANYGQEGVNVGTIIFSTVRRDGITQNGKVSYRDAWQRLKEKHAL